MFHSQMKNSLRCEFLLDWRYDEDQKKIYMQKNIPHGYSDNLGKIKTDHDLIVSWSNFFREKCNHTIWDGHIEQFGLVMLSMAYAIHDCRWQPNHTNENEYLAQLKCITRGRPLAHESIFSGPSGTEDYTFFRVWLYYLKHKDYGDMLDLNNPDVDYIMMHYSLLMRNIILHLGQTLLIAHFENKKGS